MQLATSMPLNINFYRFVLRCCAIIELRMLLMHKIGSSRHCWLEFELLQQLKLIIGIKINNTNRCDVEKFSIEKSIKVEIYRLQFLINRLCRSRINDVKQLSLASVETRAGRRKVG